TGETDVLKLMEQIEKLEAQIKERAPQIEARRAELNQQIAVLQQATTDDNAKLVAAQTARQTYFEALSPAPKSTYNRLSKMRNGLVLAEVKNSSCAACRVTIRPQVFYEIRRANAIIECENCGRILYYRADAAATS
ncbi:MAG: hypothetical protein HOP19_05870, partial [Acidobacteria bacterium]|nr:hypothetical protein [Acidobacteriota bacterium]